MKHFFLLVLFFSCFQTTLFAWGSTGHKIINKNAVIHLPASMDKFIQQQSFLETHSTDADTRKNTKDTAMFSEQYRHYLDVDEYPNFQNLERDFSKLVLTYGWARVKGNGTNPWAIVWFMDSLTNQLKRRDWNTAYQTAADIGHYVGDPFQPLHAANNYDGQLTGNNGIHSRYETTLLGNYQNQITIKKDSVQYISDVYDFAFNSILQSNALVDSILHADNLAKAATGGLYNTQYYTIMWQQLGAMTKNQIQSATVSLASYWYTAWINAGLIEKPTSIKNQNSLLKEFSLTQNYPNPFNPTTVISYQLPAANYVSLKVFDLLGKEIATVEDGMKEAGNYSVQFDASHLSSGLYFYQLRAGNFVTTKKMILMK